MYGVEGKHILVVRELVIGGADVSVKDKVSVISV